jgi:hypothetical protein
MSLTHVYFLALHNSLSDVFATRDKTRTPETILVTAIEHNGVLCEGFQIVALPAAIEIARFQPYIATGKLNADKTPRTPRGFGTGQNEKDELSE